jgi:dihydropteroate synthase
MLIGITRKSMIYNKLGITSEESLNGTTVLHTKAILAGAKILRVHDTKEAKEVIRILGIRQ